MKKIITIAIFSLILVFAGFILGKNIPDKKSKNIITSDTENKNQESSPRTNMDLNYIKNKVFYDLEEERLDLDEEEMELNNKLAEVKLKYENNPEKLNSRLEKLQKKQRELDFDRAELNFYSDNLPLLEQIEEKKTAIHIEKENSYPDNAKINTLINERNKLENDLKEKKNHFEKSYFNN